MKSRPVPAPPPVIKREDRAFVTDIREYELLTPLFGGGVKPMTTDPVTVIRGSSVRGQLRFWWRATRGGEFGGDLDKMRQKESLIWGSASTPSAVAIDVICLQPGKDETPFSGAGKRSKPNDDAQSPPYAAFPMQLTDDDAKKSIQPRKVRVGITFRLTLRYRRSVEVKKGDLIDYVNIEKDVAAALWAWGAFGGIGGRTRRGFGAIRCTSINNQECQLPVARELRNRIRDELKIHVSEKGKWPDGVPHLTQDTPLRAKVRTDNDSITAWRHLVTKLKSFRQMRDEGKEFGPSKWPEASAVRTITGQSASKYRNSVPASVKAFPRGQLGMPIIFHFKDDGDPVDATLTGIDFDRLASPLLLRPIACKANSRGVPETVALALILEGSRLNSQQTKLEWKGGEEQVETRLTPSEAQRVSAISSNETVRKAYADGRSIPLAFLTYFHDESSE